MTSFLYRKFLRMCVSLCPEELKLESDALTAKIDTTNSLVLANLWDSLKPSSPNRYGAHEVTIYFSMLWRSKLKKKEKLALEKIIVRERWSALPGFGELIKTLLFFLAESPLKVCLLFN